MIVVNAIIESTEAGIKGMKAAIAEMKQRSRAKSGCYDYTFSVELSNPHMIRVTEKWENMAALEAHFKEPHMAAFQQARGAHPPKSVTASFFFSSEVPGPGR